jgi:hypothetical protein
MTGSLYDGAILTAGEKATSRRDARLMSDAVRTVAATRTDHTGMGVDQSMNTNRMTAFISRMIAQVFRHIDPQRQPANTNKEGCVPVCIFEVVAPPMSSGILRPLQNDTTILRFSESRMQAEISERRAVPALHFLGDVHHLVQRRSDQAG